AERVPPDVPVRVPVGRPRRLGPAVDRPPLPAAPPRALLALRRGLHGVPLLRGDAPDRPVAPLPRHAAELLGLARVLRCERRLLRLVAIPALADRLPPEGAAAGDSHRAEDGRPAGPRPVARLGCGDDRPRARARPRRLRGPVRPPADARPEGRARPARAGRRGHRARLPRAARRARRARPRAGGGGGGAGAPPRRVPAHEGRGRLAAGAARGGGRPVLPARPGAARAEVGDPARPAGAGTARAGDPAARRRTAAGLARAHGAPLPAGVPVP